MIIRFPTLLERQAELRASILAKRKDALRLKCNRRAKKNYHLRKRKVIPWHTSRAKWAERRKGVEERRALRLQKNAAKEEAKRKREQVRKRKLKDPIAESARIFAEAFAAGKRFQAAEDAARFKTQITVV
jgi:hypothetical protein